MRGEAGEYTWLVEESDVHLLKAAKLADDNEGLQKAIEANINHLVLLEDVKKRVPAKIKPTTSLAQLRGYASVGVLENVTKGVHLKISESLKVELGNRLSQVEVVIEKMRIRNIKPPEFTIRIENYKTIGPEQITLEAENAYAAFWPKDPRAPRRPPSTHLNVGDSEVFVADLVYPDGGTEDVVWEATQEFSAAFRAVRHRVLIINYRCSLGSITLPMNRMLPVSVCWIMKRKG